MDREWKTVSGYLLKLHRDKKGTGIRECSYPLYRPNKQLQKGFFSKADNQLFILFYYIVFYLFRSPKHANNTLGSLWAFKG